MPITDPAGELLRPTPLPCPRRDCGNTMSTGPVVCPADFHALASMCRGKKRLGQPLADQIAGDGGGRAYQCPLCCEWHTGGSVRHQRRLVSTAEQTVAALRSDPRVGWRGVLQLADAWRPENVNRSCWAQGIDQREALAAP